MQRALPYSGHTWSFSQHAVGLNPKTLYEFLKCAAPFEGESANYDQKITELMIASGVLTANNRDGVPDAWRDYQQLLAELGLIYSTKICPSLTLTELGHMFLAGEIGFSELIGTQALRYQYPNGQKSTIQSRLRAELQGTESLPSTLTELQTNTGLLIKPGTLILRVLLELQQAGFAPELSVTECQAFLIPCKTNQEWAQALSDIVAIRRTRETTPDINRHSRRNIQDWFKLLGKTDFFESDGSSRIRLSGYVLNNLSEIYSYCTLQEDPISFWIPTKFDIAGRMQWFDWFGHLSYESQKSLRADVASNSDYIEKNYVGGIEDENDDSLIPETSNVNLQPLDLLHLGRETEFKFKNDINALAESLRLGAQKRHAKTLLHDRIIKDLAEKFISQGANVQSDPNSVDLYAKWPDGNSAIFEVKTVTRRSLQGRLRSAIGQIEEYAYRRHIAGAEKSDKVVVVNTELSSDAWQTEFLTQHLGIGLICKASNQYTAYAPASSLTGCHWEAQA
jgi:hypothetical protein